MRPAFLVPLKVGTAAHAPLRLLHLLSYVLPMPLTVWALLCQGPPALISHCTAF